MLPVSSSLTLTSSNLPSNWVNISLNVVSSSISSIPGTKSVNMDFLTSYLEGKVVIFSGRSDTIQLTSNSSLYIPLTFVQSSGKSNSNIDSSSLTNTPLTTLTMLFGLIILTLIL